MTVYASRRERDAAERATIRRLVSADHKPTAWRVGRPAGFAYNCSCGFTTGLLGDARFAREAITNHLRETA